MVKILNFTMAQEKITSFIIKLEPLYYFIISFVIGILFENIFSLGWPTAIFIAFVSLVVYLYLSREDSRTGKIILIVAAAFCLGILRMSFVDTSPDKALYQNIGRVVSFEARVSEEPDTRDTSTRYIVKPSLASAHVDDCLASLTEASTRNFSAEKYPCNQQHVPSKSLVLVVADRYPEVGYGDKISVSGKLELPKNFVNDNGSEFDYVSYLKKDKIHFIMYYPELEKIEDASGNRAVSFLYSIKNIFIKKISAVVPEPNSSFLAGLIFGARQTLGSELLEDFRKVGLIHIVVLSGYNMTVIAAGIFAGVSYFGKRNLSFTVSSVSIILFSIMVGLGATVVRAAIMALIAILAKFLGRPSDALRWLFIAGFMMLLWNPLSLLYDPSFQLSFMATLGLIIFSPFVLDFVSKNKIKRFIPEKYGIREIVAATLSVQLFILPLLVQMSGEVSLVSFLVNPLLLPLVPIVMALGAATGGAGLLPLLGNMLSWPLGVLAYFSSQIIISVTELSASLPLASIPIGAIPPIVILLWYVGYAVLYWKLKTASSHLRVG